MKEKKAEIEFSIITFVIIVFGVLMISPFMLKVFNDVLSPVAEKVGTVTPQAQTNMEAVYSAGINFWDFVIIIAFAVNLILLFFSAFLVDSHPFFLVMFLIFGLFTFILAPTVKDTLTAMYTDPIFSQEVAQTPMAEWLVNNFTIVMLAIWFVVGVILFGKFAFGGTKPY